MPRAQDTRSFSFPGYSFQDAASVLELTGIMAVEKELPAVAAAKTGSLTTRGKVCIPQELCRELRR